MATAGGSADTEASKGGGKSRGDRSSAAARAGQAGAEAASDRGKDKGKSRGKGRADTTTEGSRGGKGSKAGGKPYASKDAGTPSSGERHWERVARSDGEPLDYLNISDDDAAFVMGPGGKTKKKIAAVSGASLELKSNRLEIGGTKEQRDRAKKYVQLVMAQRVGPVRLSDEAQHDDLSIIEVPAEAVSFVTGRQGSFLRLVEEEFGALLFFIDFDKANRRDRLEKLAVFGSTRERRGAELKVMAAIEMKQNGYFTTRDAQLPAESPEEGFATDRMPIEEEDYSYALGKGGATRKKIARASGCIIEYVGRLAYLSGLKPERARAREYLGWLFQQRVGPVEVDYVGRTDVSIVEVPKECVGFVTGHKGTSLRSIEDATGTFCFIEGGREDPHRDPKPLLVFGKPEAREQAEERLRRRIDQKLEEGWVHEEGRDWDSGNGHRWEGNGWGWSGSGDGWSERHSSRNGRGRDSRHKGSGKGRRGEKGGDDRAGHGGEPASRSHESWAGGARVKEEEEEEDDEEGADWGDWGGVDSGEEEVPAPAAGARAPGSHSNGRSAHQAHRHADGKAGWSTGLASVGTGRVEANWVEEFELPPQLLHEEAWPELGMQASPKKGKKR